MLIAMLAAAAVLSPADRVRVTVMPVPLVRYRDTAVRRVGAEGPRLWNGAVQPYVGGGVQAGLVSVEAAGAKAPLPRGRVVVETKRRRRMEWGSQLVGGLRLPPVRRLFAEARWGWQGGDRFVVAAGVLF